MTVRFRIWHNSVHMKSPLFSGDWWDKEDFLPLYLKFVWLILEHAKPQMLHKRSSSFSCLDWQLLKWFTTSLTCKTITAHNKCVQLEQCMLITLLHIVRGCDFRVAVFKQQIIEQEVLLKRIISSFKQVQEIENSHKNCESIHQCELLCWENWETKIEHVFVKSCTLPTVSFH